jgi:hypothetical protein
MSQLPLNAIFFKFAQVRSLFFFFYIMIYLTCITYPDSGILDVLLNLVSLRLLLSLPDGTHWQNGRRGLFGLPVCPLTRVLLSRNPNDPQPVFRVGSHQGIMKITDFASVFTTIRPSDAIFFFLFRSTS